MSASAMYPCVSFARALPGFEATVAAWETLAARSSELRFFQHPDWYRALFSAALANPDEFLFVTCQASASAGAQPVAVLPLRMSTVDTLGLPVRTLGLVAHPHAALAGGLFEQAQHADAQMATMLAALQAQADLPWDVLRLDKVPARCGGRLPDAYSAEGASAYLDTRSHDLAFGRVSPSFIRELRRRTRTAEEVAPLSHEVHIAAADLDAALMRWLDVEAASWKGEEGSGIRHNDRLVAFYRALARSFGARGECVIFILRHGDVDVAAQFGLLVNGTLNLLKIGYRQTHADLAPGNLIMERTIRWCCAQPQVNELSFVTNPPWGHLWRPLHERVSSQRHFNLTPRGHLLRWSQRARQWSDRRGASRAAIQHVPVSPRASTPPLPR